MVEQEEQAAKDSEEERKKETLREAWWYGRRPEWREIRRRAREETSKETDTKEVKEETN